jgi:DNA-binding transcriptional ArsR family regulator
MSPGVTMLGGMSVNAVKHCQWSCGLMARLHHFITPSRWSLMQMLVYALTGICAVRYMNSVESVFEVIAEPNRRAILSLLVSSQRSVGEIERQLRMPQPTVSKHLRVLREAGFVESTVDAQRRLYQLKPEPLQEVDAWLAPFRRFWSAHLDALERHLDRMDQSNEQKRKKH